MARRHRSLACTLVKLGCLATLATGHSRHPALHILCVYTASGELRLWGSTETRPEPWKYKAGLSTAFEITVQ